MPRTLTNALDSLINSQRGREILASALVAAANAAAAALIKGSDGRQVAKAREKEGLGYPTQKPLALLERVINTSSNEGDLVLDPFCGCGTSIHAAQKLNRRWIGIDITHLAIGLIERRLKDAFPGIKFEVHGTPKDFDGAEDLALRDKYQFQWWAVTLINAVPYGGKKKGADGGIDGYYYCKPDGKKTAAGNLG